MRRAIDVVPAWLPFIMVAGIWGCQRPPEPPPPTPTPTPTPTPSATPSPAPAVKGVGTFPLRADDQQRCRAVNHKDENKVEGETNGDVAWLVNNECTQPHKGATGQHTGTNPQDRHTVAFALREFVPAGQGDCPPAAEPVLAAEGGTPRCVTANLICDGRRIQVGDGRQRALVCPIPGNACYGCYRYNVTVDGVVSDPEVVIRR